MFHFQFKPYISIKVGTNAEEIILLDINSVSCVTILSMFNFKNDMRKKTEI